MHTCMYNVHVYMSYVDLLVKKVKNAGYSYTNIYIYNECSHSTSRCSALLSITNFCFA